jgi:MSHA biogenesis protein MshI
LLNWFAREKKVPGWLAVTAEADLLEFAHGRFDPGARPVIGIHGVRKLDGGLARVAHDMRLARYEVAALLRPGEYQFLQVDAPNVPKEELRSAIRWKIRDMIDYHVDDATVDVLDIPPPEGAGARTRFMYAISARNDLIEARIRLFEQARVPLSVIDIPETAQRNIAALYEDDERAVALAYFAARWGLLTINWRRELYLARRIDVGLEQLAPGTPARDAAQERVAVEIQRTLDHFDRQFGAIPVATMLIAPAPQDGGMAQYLRGRLGIDAQELDLARALAFEEGVPEREMQWRLFHHFGASLRHEAKAL